MSTDGVRCPASDCTFPVDIVLRSSDNELIGAHQENLAQFSEGFPPPDVVTHHNEPVDLSEDGETLSLLMQFMHKNRLPDLSNLVDRDSQKGKNFDLLYKLAEAAEKYMVYPAMAICKVRISEDTIMITDPLRAFVYATKFNYPDVASAAGPWTVTHTLDEVYRALGTAHLPTFVAWVRYREKLLLLGDKLRDPPHDIGRWKVAGALKNGSCNDADNHWGRFYAAVLHSVPKTSQGIMRDNRGQLFTLSSPLALFTEDHLHILDTCPNGFCRARAEKWSDDCFAYLKTIPSFLSFMTSP